jgi:hypothetical protein
MNIDTIIALLAKTTSENEHEAKQALDAAWKRMKREGITLLDLLNQPKERLYQSSLMRIAELTALEKYPTQRIDRESYLSDLYLVVTAFFQQSTSEQPEGKGRKAEEESKAEKAQRAYDQAQREREANNRRKQEDEQREQTSQSHQRPPPKADVQNPALTTTPFWKKVLIPHPAYFRDTIYQELSHNFINVAILFLATLCSGILFGFLLSGVFIYFGSIQVGIVVRYIGLYIGAIGSLNFYLWKHRGFRWDH